MRSNKTYSNTPFTKRVDYDGGSHRGAKARAGRPVCRRCGSVYLRRRWLAATDPRAQVLGAVGEPTICPACDMAEKGTFGGALRLEGEFVKTHGAELEHLVRKEAERAGEDNPTGRILTVDTATPGVIAITTTTEHLVERLGRAVKHAFDGTIDYGFSHGNKFARATWKRD